MELGKQIKKYRNEASLSQEALAEKVFVSRQTISNWENNKSYPDVNSLILLSETFTVSLDQLIKGDVERMQEKIQQGDQKHFQKLSLLYTVMFLIVVLTPVPLAHFLSRTGIVIYFVLFGISMYIAFLIEKEKNSLDIQTYKEIVAFTTGKNLDEIEKAKEEGKRPYQKMLMVIVSVCITLAVTFFLLWILS